MSTNTLKPVWLYFENGVFLEAKSFGFETTFTGEIVFNTSLTGYEEIITDPSYAGQFITFTMPEIGNVGVNVDDMESFTAFAKGVIVRNYQKRYSNFRAKRALDQLLKEFEVMGICDIDTRFLTKMVRNEGSMMMIASTKISDPKKLKEILKNSPHIKEINYIKEVSTKKPYTHDHGLFNIENFTYNSNLNPKAKIVVIDFGVKKNILNCLTQVGFKVEVVPSNFNVKMLIKRKQEKEIDAVFLSNGPGDPLILKMEIANIKELINAKIPIFGICLGHQLLSIAHGFNTFKLKFGHHGGNHPVKNKQTNAIEITAQNHNYNVPNDIKQVATITHINLFDKTIEGLKYHNNNIFSIQYHPEASPGPHENHYIFKQFLDNIL